jgi:hypothetical protein
MPSAGSMELESWKFVHVLQGERRWLLVRLIVSAAALAVGGIVLGSMPHALLLPIIGPCRCGGGRRVNHETIDGQAVAFQRGMQGSQASLQHSMRLCRRGLEAGGDAAARDGHLDAKRAEFGRLQPHRDRPAALVDQRVHAAHNLRWCTGMVIVAALHHRERR